MAVMNALLKIKADVEGEGKIAGLGRSIGGLQASAGKVTGSLRGMTSSVGGLAGAMGSLTPLLSAAGLIGLGKAALDTGKKLWDMSERTGVSVEMLAKFKKAASLSGTTIDVVGSALARLAKAMTAAASSGFAGKTKAEIEKAVDAVKDGEERQTDEVQKQADRRIEKLERESDQRLRELNKRYRQEEKLLNDRYDDTADREQEAADTSLREQERALEKQFERRRRAIEDDKSLSDDARTSQLDALKYEQEDALRLLRDGFERQQKERTRRLRDARQLEQDSLDERRYQEEQGLRQSLERQKAAVKDGADGAVKAIKNAAEQATKALKADDAGDELSQQMEDLGLSGKGASEAFQQLGIAVKNQDGSLRSADAVMLDIATKFRDMPDGVEKTALAMKLFGRSGAELIPMLNMGGDAISQLSVKMTTAFAKKADEYGDKLLGLSGKVGGLGADIMIVLLPALEALTDVLTGALTAFNNLDPTIKNIVIGATALGIALLTVAPALASIVYSVATIGPALLGLLPFLANIQVILAGLATVVQVAFSGLLTWIGSVLVPGILAFIFSPAGLVALIVAGVIALVWVLRKPIGDFAAWLVTTLQKALDGLLKLAYVIFVDPFVKIWSLIKEPVQRFGQWIGDTFRSIWPGIVNGAKAALRGVLQWMANGINNMAGLINRLIGAFNRLPGPDIPFIPSITVPAFAQGGYVGGPTLAMVGEGGQGEYIIPANRMAAASANYLSGARGNAVLSGTSSAPQINITTGPVLQQDGQRWVSVDDLEQAMRATAEGVLARMRTPAARVAFGIR